MTVVKLDIERRKLQSTLSMCLASLKALNANPAKTAFAMTELPRDTLKTLCELAIPEIERRLERQIDG
jgi:hypothetical protein